MTMLTQSPLPFSDTQSHDGRALPLFQPAEKAIRFVSAKNDASPLGEGYRQVGGKQTTEERHVFKRLLQHLGDGP